MAQSTGGGGGDYIFRYTMTQGSDATRGFLGGLGPYVVGIKIDDVVVPVGTTQYFFAAGDHTVELTLSEGTIPANCFVLGSEIKGIELVGEFKSIGERAFLACGGITQVSMDCQALETVGPGAFAQMWNVVSFNNEADATLDFASISSLGGGSLTGIVIGNAAVKFGDMLTSFGNSSGYQGAAISERSPNGGFDIEFGTGLATIYGGAIDRCRIRNIVCKATTPPTFVPTSQTSIIFQGELLGNIKVPAASVAAYKAASGWSDYASQIIAI